MKDHKCLETRRSERQAKHLLYLGIKNCNLLITMNTLQLVSLAFVLAVLVSLPAPSEGLRSTARWSLLKRIRTIKLNHERLIAAAEAAGMKTTTKACKEIVDSVDEIKQPAKITQDLSPTTSAIQKSKPGQKAMKNKM